MSAPTQTLTQDQIDLMVNKAWFFGYIQPNVTNPTGMGVMGYYGNNAPISGEGAVDLEKVEAMQVNWPHSQVWLDVGPEPMYPRLVKVNSTDIAALKAAFIARYGDVVKPSVYGQPPVVTPPVI